MRRKYLAFTITLILSKVFCLAQGVRPEILVLADSLNGCYNEEVVGEVKSGQDLTRRETPYDRFSKNATEQELVLLTNYHNNPSARACAFKALARRLYKNIIPLLLERLKDTAIIGVGGGCMYGDAPVSNVCLDQIYPGARFRGRYGYTTYLDSTQVAYLDSVLLYSDGINSKMRYELLLSFDHPEKYHNRIRQIVKNENDGPALVALARYKDVNDTIIIGSVLHIIQTDSKDVFEDYYDAWAIKEYPCKAFYNYLIEHVQEEKTHFEYNRMYILCEALAQYPDNATYNIFNSMVTDTLSANYKQIVEIVALAVHRYPNPVFTPLNQALKVDKAGLFPEGDKFVPW